jgi:tetratricopeptide (TPR) repeat protein
MTVNGQVAVMAINGLLTKVMFDHNPDNEFFVEESFPLDWMYPYETPFGVIMKVNRQPLSSLSSDILERDHEFWAKYSERLIGNWIDDQTPIKDIVDFVEKVYQRKDFSGFKGDRKFIRDDDAQKAFSKLRSSIAGVYAWRLNPQTPAEYRPKTAAEFKQITKECDFAFRQSFAFCPYSPEAVFRYVNFLLQFNRLDDALLVAQTCLKVDPNSGAAADLVRRLDEFKKNAGDLDKTRSSLQQMEAHVRDHPTDYQAAFNLAAAYIQLQQVDHADEVLDRVLSEPNVPLAAVLAVAQAYAQLNDWPKLEKTLEIMIKVAPDSPEAWYDLAGLKCNMGKNDESLKCLARAIELSNARLAKDPKQRNLIAEAGKDPRFAPIRNLPEFQKLVAQ